MPDKDSVEEYKEVYGLVYALDTKTPVCKYYRAYKSSKTNNLVVFEPTWIETKELKPEIKFEFDFKNLMSKENGFVRKIKSIKNNFISPDHLNELLGSLINKSLLYEHNDISGKVKLSPNDIIKAYNDVVNKPTSNYYVSPSTEGSLHNMYSSVCSQITQGKDSRKQFSWVCCLILLNMKQVTKRNGQKEEFNFEKIKIAVGKAIGSQDPNKWETTTGKLIGPVLVQALKTGVNNLFSDQDGEVSVEDIQDVVERIMMVNEYYDAAKRYILYREEHRKIRERDYVILNRMKEKLEAKNIENQNANVDEMSFGGRVGEASRIALKQLALSDYMSETSRNNHINNEIYIHDLDSYAIGDHNCLSIPFDDLLAKGFNTRQTDVRPANSINTAFQLVAVIFQLQSLQQFGGVAATHLD